MKFGNNLQYLSIPEWRCYNLDYNDLKISIRKITQSSSSDLRPLKASFIENFDYVNLFILTKLGEISRKLSYFKLLLSDTLIISDKRLCHIQIDDIYYQTIELGTILKHLSKFILIQKIATKKIFKKFVKYYNGKGGEDFVRDLKLYLAGSFVSIDLGMVTKDLTEFVNEVKERQRALVEDLSKGNIIGDSGEIVGISNANGRYMGSNGKKVPARIANFASNEQDLPASPESINSSNLTNDTLQPHQRPLTADAAFELTTSVKKNFNLHCLVPDDPSTVNDIVLNLNLYLNLTNNNYNALISYIYLNGDDVTKEPSYIFSQKGDSFSFLIAYTGGLRKYSYCMLPNDIIKLVISILLEKDNAQKRSLKKALARYFAQFPRNSLTKATIDTFINEKLVPKLKLACTRSRYTLGKDDHNQEYRNQLLVERAFELVDDEGSAPSVPSSNKKYQDDYLITLDIDIYTTNDSKLINSIDFEDNYTETFDKFPHNHLTFYSNDSNLQVFEDSLETIIDAKEGLLESTYNNSYLRKLPNKIQDLISNNTSLNLYKNLDFYQYMISCYFNVIPLGENVNNHYTNLLDLNLLKNFENIENFNNQLTSENTLIKKKSNQILKRQLSMKSLDINEDEHRQLIAQDKKKQQLGQQSYYPVDPETQQYASKPPLLKINSTVSFASTKFSMFSIFTNNNNEEDDEVDAAQQQVASEGQGHFFQPEFSPHDEEDEDDYYSFYYKLNHEDAQETSWLDSFILKSLKFRNKFWNDFSLAFSRRQSQDSILPRYYPHSQYGKDGDSSTSLMQNSTQNLYYDSINEEPPSFLDRHNFVNIQAQYEVDYDRTLAFIYFSLNLISIFLSGIELGISYSISVVNGSSPGDSDFLFSKNLWLIWVWIMGLLLSLIFSLVSINLNFQRYNPPPLFHSFCQWSGFTVVCVCCIWSSVFLFSGT